MERKALIHLRFCRNHAVCNWEISAVPFVWPSFNCPNFLWTKSFSDCESLPALMLHLTLQYHTGHILRRSCEIFKRSRTFWNTDLKPQQWREQYTSLMLQQMTSDWEGGFFIINVLLTFFFQQEALCSLIYIYSYSFAGLPSK